MKTLPLYKRPTYLLFLIWLGCLALCAAAAWLSLQQPWLGVQLTADGDTVRMRGFPVQGIPANAKLRRLEAGNNLSLDIQADDVPGKNKYFPSYAHMEQFFARQEILNTILHSGEVRLIWLDAENREQATSIVPGPRRLSSVPGVFWFQLFIISTSFMIGCWILLLRPQDWGARMFAATGLMLFISGLTAAVYGSRELAMSAAWVRGLQAGNLLAVYLFGCALIALFLSYPKQLVKLRGLLWLPALYLLWYSADQMHWLPEPKWGMQIPMLSQLLLVLAAAAMQWQHTRGQPLERAALRWFLLSVLLGCSLFTFVYVLPLLLDRAAILPLGYSFGFFLIMYIGIALGLGRYRLFDMDEWAYRALLWVAGAIAVIILDALLIIAGMAQGISLGISLLLAGGLYFPFRQWLWQRIVNKRIPKFESLLPELSTIAFAPTDEQQARWQALLRHVYAPLEILVAETGGSGIREEGLALQIPGCDSLSPCYLRFAGHGARLFSTQDAVFAASLSHALAQMMAGRHSYEEGAAQERNRIYRDLHDDMGAKLLGLAISAQRANLPREADLARSALQDLRDVVSRSAHTATPLGDLLADWRIETEQRVRAAGLVLEWRFPERESGIGVSPEAALNMSRILREAISNVLRHAGASRIEVETWLDEQHFGFSIGDNGAGLPSEKMKKHRGMTGMQARANALGAGLEWKNTAPGCRVEFSVQLTALST